MEHIQKAEAILRNEGVPADRMLDELLHHEAKVARIDRLPESNSLEGLLMLQDAWDHYDIYSDLSSQYKIISKMSYLLLLLNGIALTILAIGSSGATGLSLAETKYGILA